tara:strand:+ start:14341 stop:14550 length:210 start_codon:yes stop_codon:yes gene_type:complete
MVSTNNSQLNEARAHSSDYFYSFISYPLKVKVVYKYFSALGIDYDVIKGDEPTWFIKKNDNPKGQKKIF